VLVSLSTLSNEQNVSPCPLFLLFVYKSVSCLCADSAFGLPCIYRIKLCVLGFYT
jgi:hypothetical protein